MRTLLFALFAAGLCISETLPANAQVVIRGRTGSGAGAQAMQGAEVGKRKFADKPLARIWHSKINMTNTLAYMQKVSQEMDIKGSQIMMMPPGADRLGGAEGTQAAPKQELKGMLVYMAKGLIPSVETFSFKRVADEKEFRKLVLQAKAMWGKQAKLTGSKDRYEVSVDMQQLVSGAGTPDPGEDGDEETDGESGGRVAISFSFKAGSDSEEMPEGIAEPMGDFEMLSVSTFYRYYDGIMFESTAPELHEMKLPKQADLTLRRAENALDLYADVDLSQIPPAFKEIFWATIKSKANSMLQQYDEEPDEEYRFRKSSGDLSLELTRTAIMDLDRVRLSLKFAEGENKPLQADLIVDARKNSNLAKQLGQVSRGVSRFDALREQDSPMTVASAWQMPNNFRTVVKAMFEHGKIRLQEQLAADPDALLAVEDMFVVLSETIDDGAADAIMKLGGDAKDGYAVYGGLRIKGATQLAKSLSTALNGLPKTLDSEISTKQEDGREFLSFRLDELRLPGVDENEQLPAQLHFTVAESCLWFSLGGKTSFDVLKSCLADLEGKTSRSAPAAPFVLDLNLSEWLKSEKQEAQNPFSEVPMETLQRFEQMLHRSMANTVKGSSSMPSSIGSQMKMDFRDSYLAKALQEGQDELYLEIDTSPKTVRAKARVGEGVIKFFVARVMDVQNRAFENLKIRFQDSEDGETKTIRVGGPESDK